MREFAIERFTVHTKIFKPIAMPALIGFLSLLLGGKARPVLRRYLPTEMRVEGLDRPCGISNQAPIIHNMDLMLRKPQGEIVEILVPLGGKSRVVSRDITIRRNLG